MFFKIFKRLIPVFLLPALLSADGEGELALRGNIGGRNFAGNRQFIDPQRNVELEQSAVNQAQINASNPNVYRDARLYDNAALNYYSGYTGAGYVVTPNVYTSYPSTAYPYYNTPSTLDNYNSYYNMYPVNPSAVNNYNYPSAPYSLYYPNSAYYTNYPIQTGQRVNVNVR